VITLDLGGVRRRARWCALSDDARVSDIKTLLNNYQASIVGGAQEGMFRLQFGNGAMRKDEVAALLSKLQKEKIVSLAVETP
jgi:hypothetical protein